MTWWCTECQLNNQQNLEYCSSCQKHWSATWKKRRSRSAQQKEKREKAKKEREKQEQKDAPAATKDNVPKDAMCSVIPEGMPWMPTTPQAHLAHRDVAGPVITPEAGLPPPPVLPVPPAPPAGPPHVPALTAEEQQALSHLRGLASLGVGFPAELETKYQMLLGKEKEAAGGKALTHTHLHKLNRLKSQVQSAEKKIISLDAEWAAFVETVTKKLQMHGQCYQQYRADLMETYNKKLADLALAKQEVSQASQMLTGQGTDPSSLMGAPDLEADFRHMQEVLMRAGTVDQVQLVSDDGMEEEELQEASPVAGEAQAPSPHIKPARATSYRTTRPTPFARGTNSPQKVQQNHLKRPSVVEHASKKDDKEREKDGKGAADNDEVL
eukprot:Skav235145  [mRNA]  locus=scaffold1072:88465:89610:- [translate_table: standard]